MLKGVKKGYFLGSIADSLSSRTFSLAILAVMIDWTQKWHNVPPEKPPRIFFGRKREP